MDRYTRLNTLLELLNARGKLDIDEVALELERGSAPFSMRSRRFTGPGTAVVSTVSSMMWIGPRVTMAMGEDLRALSWLAHKNSRGIPVPAIVLQAVVATFLLVQGSFETVVSYVQFALALSSALAVAGVMVLRWRQPDLPRPYRAWGYPVTPLIFLGVTTWMMWHRVICSRSRTAVRASATFWAARICCCGRF